MKFRLSPSLQDTLGWLAAGALFYAILILTGCTTPFEPPPPSTAEEREAYRARSRERDDEIERKTRDDEQILIAAFPIGMTLEETQRLHGPPTRRHISETSRNQDEFWWYSDLVFLHFHNGTLILRTVTRR